MSYSVDQAGWKLSKYFRITLNSWFSSLYLPSPRITSLNHHPWHSFILFFVCEYLYIWHSICWGQWTAWSVGSHLLPCLSQGPVFFHWKLPAWSWSTWRVACLSSISLWELGHYNLVLTAFVFTWVLGIQAQVLMLTWAIYLAPLSVLFSFCTIII